ncbi:MAG TPA: cytosine permease [Gaiellaceae bacterium]|nr:cytosine permease [Gaiellaceae bacterium]
MSETPSWGIEPVPDRLRVLGALDTGLLWGSLGMSLLVVVAGVLLVPALSLPDALLAILVGGVAGNLMLALAALIGTDARVPGMVVLRAPLGRHGSYLATAVNVAQNVGWTIFELIVIATAAAALSDRLFGWSGKWLWTLAAAAATTALALIGPVTFVRRWVRKVAIWVVLASLGYLTWWAIDGAHLHELWSQPGKGGLSFWAAVDLTIAMPVSWLPLAADYTRFCRNRSSSFVGTFAGYLIPNIWLYALGALLLLSRGLGDAPSLLIAIAGAGAGAGLALVALGIDETKEPFANVYSAAVSIQNLLPRVPQRLLIVVVAAGSTLGALAIDLARYMSFLFLLGSAFVPLFGVLLADWLLAGAHYSRDNVFRAPAVRVELLGAWLAGFCLYQWLEPVGPRWWTSLVEQTHPHALPWGGASLPSFAASFALAAVLGLAVPRIAALLPERA